MCCFFFFLVFPWCPHGEAARAWLCSCRSVYLGSFESSSSHSMAKTMFFIFGPPLPDRSIHRLLHSKHKPDEADSPCLGARLPCRSQCGLPPQS